MPHVSAHTFQLPKFSLAVSHDLKALYAIRLILHFADRFAGFFVPVFIFQQAAVWSIPMLAGFSDFNKGMILVATFYCLFRLTVLLVAIPTGNALHTLGMRTTITISLIAHVAMMFSLYLVSYYHWMLLVSAVLFGVYVSLFWIANHVLLTRHTLRLHVGQDLGLLSFLLQIASVLAPALGGFLAYYWGLGDIYLLTMVVLLLGLIPALWLSNEKEKKGLTFGQVKTLLINPSFQPHISGFLGRYMYDIALALWPVYVLLLLGRVDRVGFLYTLSFFFALVFTMFIGYYIDHTKSKRSFITSGGVLSLLTLLRVVFSNPVGLAVIDAFDKLISSFHWIFYDSLLYRSATSRNSLVYFVTREMVIAAGGVIIWLVVVALFIAFEYAWVALFGLGSVGALLTTLMNDRIVYDQKSK